MSVLFERIAKRQQLKERLNIESYEVLLDEDRDHHSFASPFFHESLQTLSIEDQKKVQLGTQWINSFQSIHPVLVGNFARAFHANKKMELYLPIEFTLRHNYIELARYAKMNFEATVSHGYFEIKKFGLRVLHEPDSMRLLSALYPIFFGARVLIENMEVF